LTVLRKFPYTGSFGSRRPGGRRALAERPEKTGRAVITERGLPMISKKLAEDMKTAMKSGERERLGVIRMLLSELKNAEIAAARKLSAEEEERVVASYAKKRQEAVDAYQQAGRMDLLEKERRERDITLSYLPPKLSEEELARIVAEKIAETGAQGMKDFGRVMKAVMASVGSRADGSVVSAAVKKFMSGQG
jgi:uncharacterized protein YqeY